MGVICLLPRVLMPSLGLVLGGPAAVERRRVPERRGVLPFGVQATDLEALVPLILVEGAVLAGQGLQAVLERAGGARERPPFLAPVVGDASERGLVGRREVLAARARALQPAGDAVGDEEVVDAVLAAVRHAVQHGEGRPGAGLPPAIRYRLQLL